MGSIEIVVNLELTYNKKYYANLEYKVFTNRFMVKVGRCD